MQDKTLPQPENLHTAKQLDPVRGDRWSVTGPGGTISYRDLSGYVAIRSAGPVKISFADGDTDHAVGNWPVRCAAAVATGNDDAVFAVLAELYAANFGSRS